MKKFLKITGIVVLILIIILAIVPFLFQDQIEKSIKNAANDNLNAKVEWSDLNLSLLSNFPNAHVGLENLSVINNKPFEGDTLLYTQNLSLKMGLFQLLSPNDLAIDQIAVSKSVINIKTNTDGATNYDIVKPNNTKEKESNTTQPENNFSLKLKSYEILDSKIVYRDAEAMLLTLDDFNHTGKGDFSKNIFILNTHTDSQISFDYEDTAYLNQNSILLEADVEMNLNDMRFTFKDNNALINKLPLMFDGYVQVNKNDQDININFTTPNSDFKNLLALVPETYSGNLEGMQTNGEFELDGRLYGVIDDKHIPKINISINSQNSEFQYKDLPKSVENINIDMKVVNDTGIVEDTEIDINTIDFSIDKDRFSGSAHFKDLTENMKGNIIAKGTINLSNIAQAYPVDADLDLNGVLKADFETSFDMNSIENKQYQNIKSKGLLRLSDFKYASSDLANPFEIETANVDFYKGEAKLSNFNMKTGETDIQASGELNNLIGYLFSDQDLTGRFQANSERFAVNDFMTEVTEDSTKEPENTEANIETNPTTEAIKIPKGLDIALDFKAKEVIYDNYKLKNAKGQLSVKDQKANLNEIQADLFGGQVLLDGNLSTKETTPTFGMNLKLQNIDIAKSIDEIEMLNAFTPILKSLVGKLTTEFDFSGDMTQALSPILTTLNGNGLANIIQAKVEPSKMGLTNSLNKQLNVININDLKLEDVITTFKFQDGAVSVDPITIKIEDFEFNLEGEHSLNNVMDYKVNLKLPAKYFGDEVSSQLAKLTNKDLNAMKVDIPIGISGNLKQPKINIDMEKAVIDLTNQIIKQQKDNLLNQAGNEINELLGGKAKNDKATDSTSTDSEKLEDKVKGVLGGVLGGKKKKNKEKDN